MAGLFSSFASSPYVQAPLPTKDDMLGPGNTAPQAHPTNYPDNYPSPQLVGMGGSVVQQPLPLATVQQPIGQQQVVTRPPISSDTAQGKITAPYNGPMVSGYRPNPLYQPPLRADLLMPGGWNRRPETKTGGIMTQSHPDFIGRINTDMSGGVRPGQMPGMSAVEAARLANGQNPGLPKKPLGQ